jgi:hypothetical protein
MALDFIYIACAGFLMFAGALASSKTDAKFPEIQMKEMMFFAREFESQGAKLFKTVSFQFHNTKHALAQW